MKHCTRAGGQAAKPPGREPVEPSTVLAGMDFIWRRRILLSATSPNLFAVLLDGSGVEDGIIRG